MTPSSALCNSLVSHQMHPTSLGINCSAPGATLSSFIDQQGRQSLCSSPALQVPRFEQGQTWESRPAPCQGRHTDTQGMAVLRSRLWHRHSFFFIPDVKKARCRLRSTAPVSRNLRPPPVCGRTQPPPTHRAHLLTPYELEQREQANNNLELKMRCWC